MIEVLHIVVAMKPLKSKNFVESAVSDGVAGLNVDECRVAGESITTINGTALGIISDDLEDNTKLKGTMFVNTQGRWPANVIHDRSNEVVWLFPETVAHGHFPEGGKRSTNKSTCYGQFGGNDQIDTRMSDSGSAARFFKKCPKDD